MEAMKTIKGDKAKPALNIHMHHIETGRAIDAFICVECLTLGNHDYIFTVLDMEETKIEEGESLCEVCNDFVYEYSCG